MKIELGREQRDGIFPANIVLDKDLRVTALGPAIARRFSDFIPGEALLDHFRPMAGGQETTVEVVAGTQTMLSLQSRKTSAVLSGWVIPYEAGYFLALRVVPPNYSLVNSSLQITDFTPDDPVVHSLLMSSIQSALLEEQRLVALELDHARQTSLDLLNRLSRTSGFLAHDFNNFLSIIKLNSDRLKLDLADNPRALRLLEIIRGAATRGSAITRSLMTLSSQRDDSRLAVSIDGLIGENKAFFYTVVGARVKLELDLAAGGVQTLISPIAALNCLVNLLINARDAMPAGGLVRLSTRVVPVHPQSAQSGPWVVIEVADNGQGMPSEVQERAFEPLFSTKAHGNGLGLASVLAFATDAGGDTRIVSTPGEGTSVFVNLPCAAQGAEVEEGESVRSEPSSLGGQAPADDLPGILVVEDEPFALEALCELLSASGFQVTGASTAATAMRELERTRFKVLLTDIILPGESGAELATIASRMDPEMKVILMSGYVPQGEDMDESWMFLRKPIDAQVVTTMLRVATRA